MTNPLAKFQPVDFRHLPVRDDNAVVTGPQQVDRLRTMMCHRHLVAQDFQATLQRHGCRRIVIDYENTHGDLRFSTLTLTNGSVTRGRVRIFEQLEKVSRLQSKSLPFVP